MKSLTQNVQILKIAIISLIIAATSIAVITQPVAAQGNAKSQVCDSIGQGGDSGCGSGAGRIQGVIETVINILSAVGGIIAVIMIIISGFKFLTAGGDSNNVSSAKNTIVYAIVGLIVIAFAQVIVRFVLQNV